MELQVGTKYQEWTLLSLEFVLRGTHKWYPVKCKCGTSGYQRKDHLLSGRNKQCRKCHTKEKLSGNLITPERLSVGDLGRVYYSALKSGALRRGLTFEVSQDFLWNLFLKQQRRCALSNLEITLSDKLKNCNVDYDAFTASLDRIDSSIGYLKDNVQWVHKDINRMKHAFEQPHFLYLCSLVNNHANPERSVVNDIEVTTNVQRLGGEESTNNPPTSAQLRECDCHKDSNGTRKCPIHG